MSWAKLAAAGLGAALFTLVCMWIGLRAAGPESYSYNLGSVEFSVAPSFSGNATVYIPIAGWEIEAPVFSAPYALHAEPRHVSTAALARASRGVPETLRTTRRQLKRAAIITFGRAFLFALLGALAAGTAVLLLLRALGYPWRTALIAGAGCLAFGVVALGTSGLWLWQSLDIKQFKQAKVTLGSGKVLTKNISRFRNDGQVSSVLQDLSHLIQSGDAQRR